MIVSKNTQDALMEIIKMCFTENRVLDRLVSVLGVKFACNNSAKLIHHNIAHYFPALSDNIGQLCLERYNISVEYGETPSASEDYSSVTEIISILEKRIIDFQTMFMGLCKITFDNNDFHVFADLQDLLENYNKIVEQVILLKDKIGVYGENNVASYDAHIQDCFWILGDK